MSTKNQKPFTRLTVELGSGRLTKYNRCRQNLEKFHWLYPSCVGKLTLKKKKSIEKTNLF
ncbi:MAG: hypothetical protein F6K54_30750 [Okeania sp. SIO3B5]|uniref:hypothetical protein n=1 Tax=Okeania sp. SIO3B5 TaxID=2607811 RepID=UPI00140188B4|nr:hypothetical protein [Okeania sp. SIO3B5]NEO57066.1 hypothetical protein [Okeania sp. SIO3B5]